VLSDEGAPLLPREAAGRGWRKAQGEDKEEAKKNNEAARLWISGIETVKRKARPRAVYDLSATPFFPARLGLCRGHAVPLDGQRFFPDGTRSNAGIVKLPRVPIADNIPGGDMPKFRELWKHVGPKMPKKGRGKSGELDPSACRMNCRLRSKRCTATHTKTFALWDQEGIDVPPVFIVVCNNTSTSKLVYDFISGFVVRAMAFGSKAARVVPQL